MSNIYFASDMHFGDAKILKLSQRPFRSVPHMNARLIYHWNQVVQPSDLAYYIGDMTYHGSKRELGFWLDKLNGEIIFVKGNHDKTSELKECGVEYHSSLFVSLGGYDFLLKHQPDKANTGNYDWLIHGHTHKSFRQSIRLINWEQRRINVNVEATGYRPISLDQILDKIRKQ